MSINNAEREADFWIFGGIFRPVFLEVIPKTYFTRIATDPKTDGSLTSLLTLSQIPKNAKVQLEVLDQGSSAVLVTFSQDIYSDSVWMKNQILGIKSWNPEAPNLYDLRYSLIQDGELTYQKTERVGFRTIELRKSDGFYVNEVKVIFKRGNRHSSYPTIGRALSEDNHREDIGLMKER